LHGILLIFAVFHGILSQKSRHAAEMQGCFFVAAGCFVVMQRNCMFFAEGRFGISSEVLRLDYSKVLRLDYSEKNEVCLCVLAK